MKTHYYYRALRKQIIQFLDLFNDIQIARYDDDMSILQYVKVPLKFAPKEKVWYWTTQRKDDEMLPMMSVQMNSMEYGVDRVTNKHRRIMTSDTPSGFNSQQFLNPSPWNFGFQVNLWSLYISDIDQMLEQILPFFEPHIMMRLNITELGINNEVKVVFQGAAPDYTYEMPDEERRILKWDLDFMIHGYLYKPISDIKLIKEIITKLYTAEYGWGFRGTETTFTSGASGHEDEAMWIKALGRDEDEAILYNYEIFGAD